MNVFDDLNPRLCLSFAKLVMTSSAPAKSAGDARYASQDPFIQFLIDWLSHTNYLNSKRNKELMFSLRQMQLNCYKYTKFENLLFTDDSRCCYKYTKFENLLFTDDSRCVIHPSLIFTRLICHCHKSWFNNGKITGSIFQVWEDQCVSLSPSSGISPLSVACLFFVNDFLVNFNFRIFWFLPKRMNHDMIACTVMVVWLVHVQRSADTKIQGSRTVNICKKPNCFSPSKCINEPFGNRQNLT